MTSRTTTVERYFALAPPTPDSPGGWPLGKPSGATPGDMAIVAALLVVAERIDELVGLLREAAA